MHGFKLGAYVFGVIFVAELPDKTALAALVLATRHRALPVFLGSALALTVQSAVAVAAGSLFSLLPARAVHWGAGIVFIGSAFIMWTRKEQPGKALALEKDDGRAHTASAAFWKAAATVFGVVFIAEWGDLTQLATAAFAARERSPVVIFIAATAALWAVAGIAVGIGNRAAKVLDPMVTKRVAAILFAAIGVALVIGYL
jgi:putative Ca2+/H+ antiporter (TMEM165/GDT1 family)